MNITVGCKRTFKKYFRLADHLNLHGDHKFACNYENCQVVYKNRNSLETHIRKVHMTSKDSKGEQTKQQHICEICGHVSNSASNLKFHSYTHMNKSEYPHACPLPNCQRRFTSKYQLHVHTLRHQDIRIYECSECGAMKVFLSELKIHMNYHSKEKQYPCQQCSLVFNSSGNLSRHRRIVHENVRNFACQYCERKFTTKEVCRYHEMTHTGEKPEECPECGKANCLENP